MNGPIFNKSALQYLGIPGRLIPLAGMLLAGCASDQPLAELTQVSAETRYLIEPGSIQIGKRVQPVPETDRMPAKLIAKKEEIPVRLAVKKEEAPIKLVVKKVVVTNDEIWAAKVAALQARNPKEEARADFAAGDHGLYVARFGMCPGLRDESISLFDLQKKKWIKESDYMGGQGPRGVYGDSEMRFGKVYNREKYRLLVANEREQVR